MDRRIQHRLGRQRQRVIKRLRRAREVREADERQIAMKLEQANQVRLTVRTGYSLGARWNIRLFSPERVPADLSCFR